MRNEFTICSCRERERERERETAGGQSQQAENLKIAYICLCHIDPEFVSRTANALQYKDDAMFIHVDNKVDIKPFLEACDCHSNVHFVFDRIDNYWGGYNSVEATIRTIKLALATDRYDRFILLQGQDYPLKSPEEIHRFFQCNRDIEFCHAKDISASKQKGDYMKCCGFWSNDYNRKNLLLRCFHGGIHRINKLGIKYRSSTFRFEDDSWHVFHGWAQWSLTFNCITYIIDCHDNMPLFNRFMKHRFPPDEIYFHTLIYNSKFKKNISNKFIHYRINYENGKQSLLNLTYFEYPVLVTIFTAASDYDWLRTTGCLFVRKVNSSSKELLDRIDSDILK